MRESARRWRNHLAALPAGGATPWGDESLTDRPGPCRCRCDVYAGIPEACPSSSSRTCCLAPPDCSCPLRRRDSRREAAVARADRGPGEEPRYTRMHELRSHLTATGGNRCDGRHRQFAPRMFTTSRNAVRKRELL